METSRDDDFTAKMSLQIPTGTYYYSDQAPLPTFTDYSILEHQNTSTTMPTLQKVINKKEVESDNRNFSSIKYTGTDKNTEMKEEIDTGVIDVLQTTQPPFKSVSIQNPPDPPEHILDSYQHFHNQDINATTMPALQEVNEEEKNTKTSAMQMLNIKYMEFPPNTENNAVNNSDKMTRKNVHRKKRKPPCDLDSWYRKFNLAKRFMRDPESFDYETEKRCKNWINNQAKTEMTPEMELEWFNFGQYNGISVPTMIKFWKIDSKNKVCQKWKKSMSRKKLTLSQEIKNMLIEANIFTEKQINFDENKILSEENLSTASQPNIDNNGRDGSSSKLLSTQHNTENNGRDCSSSPELNNIDNNGRDGSSSKLLSTQHNTENNERDCSSPELMNDFLNILKMSTKKDIQGYYLALMIFLKKQDGSKIQENILQYFFPQHNSQSLLEL